MIETTAFWGFTINNYDETELALVQQGYPDYIRELVYTLEEGKKTGTPHIQGWFKLQRQQRQSFVKKLFPRASFKPLMKAEYDLNAKRYAQKLDETAVSGAFHRFNDPIHTIESVIKAIVMRMLYDTANGVNYMEYGKLRKERLYQEQMMVRDDYRYAKIFVSATYRKMWDEYGQSMFECIWNKEQERYENTHTHTHKEEKTSRVDDTDADDNDNQGESEEENRSDTEDEDNEDSDSSEIEGYDESGSVSSGQTDDSEEC